MVLTKKLFIECRHVYITSEIKHNFLKFNEVSCRNINTRRHSTRSSYVKKILKIDEIQKRNLPWNDLDGFIRKKIWF